MLTAIKTRIANMVTRAVVKLVDDAKKFQELQVDMLNGETRDEVERVQNYGFTSVPLAGAEAVAVCVGGRRDHSIVIACDDRRYRLKGLTNGEVAIYTDEGDKIVMKRGGTIELTASTKVHLVTPLVECSTDLKVLGKLDVTGNIGSEATITGATDVVGGGKHLKTHVHLGTSLTTASSCSAGGATGTVAGSTAAPT